MPPTELKDLEALAAQVGQALQRRDSVLSTAESCTGGLAAAAITMISGSSQWFDRGFVTYSNLAKMEQLGVAPQILERHGAVSEETAAAMSEGVLQQSALSSIALSTTGIAGPGGATPGKPVGMVCFGISQRVAQGICTQTYTEYFEGGRHDVRMQAAAFILQKILHLLA